VAASGVVPGLCEPIVVGGRTMIDGGVRSSTNADLLDGVEDDLAIVSSPLSMFSPLRLTLRWMVRAHANVLLLEPDRDLRRAMGTDPMDLSRAPAVADAAYVTTLRRLREGSLRVPSALRDARRST
jgi:NTE family protein